MRAQGAARTPGAAPGPPPRGAAAEVAHGPPHRASPAATSLGVHGLISLSHSDDPQLTSGVKGLPCPPRDTVLSLLLPAPVQL